MYLAKLVKKNDESLLGFQDDLTTVRHAENIILDSVASDIKNIEADLEKVHNTASEEAARLEAAGELKPFSLSDLKELKTTVYTIDKVSHFNKVDHHSGRTPMERFALNSQDALKQATKKINKLKKKYADLLMYFGEDEKMASNEFFGTMRRFIEEFQKANDEVEKLEMARIKEEKREAKRAEKEKNKSAKAGKAKAGGKPSKASMANLASLAAAKSKTLGKGGETESAAGVGGIPALAAAAASKNKPSAAPAGGIAAMAAAAAAKNKPASAPAAGGIAAMAAAAAAKNKPTSAPAAGGIAGLAAAAAAAKNQPTSTPAAGGIAGLAAAAAAKNKPTLAPAAGGIAGLAAAAAAKKSAPPGIGTSIAGLAAMAASKKSGATPASGGIAGLAAAAAAAKQPKTPAGGIAGLAAAAAAKKSAPAAPPAGGIAGLAALAAQNKPAANKATPPSGLSAMAAASATAAKKPATKPSAPGLAALAAASTKPEIAHMAAEATSESAPLEKKNDSSAGPSTISAAGSSGLAGMAAAAKSKNDAAPVSLAKPAASAPASRGVEASSSDSLRKRKVYDEKSGLYHDKQESLSAEFRASADSTFFQLGSSDASGKGLPRVTHRRRKSGDGSIFVPRRPVARSKSDAASRNWANLQANVAGESSSTPGDWIAKSTSFPLHGTPPTADPSAKIARSQSQGGEAATEPDDFMAALGWGPKDDNDDKPSDPSISFTMRRSQRKGRDSSDVDP